jgi:hypothetical protein
MSGDGRRMDLADINASPTVGRRRLRSAKPLAVIPVNEFCKEKAPAH